MKTFVLSVIAGFASVAFAGPLTNISKLPAVFEPSVEIEYGPQLAAVQPTGWVKFKYYGCKARQFEAELAEVDDVTLIRIVRTDKPGVDCMAVIEHEARVQISSDMDLSRKFVILNPTLPRAKK